MIHPLIRLLATQPQLIAEHLGAYASLIGAETQTVKNRVVKQLMLAGLALCLVGVAVVLSGVSVMLWAVSPSLPPGAGWVLVAAPLLPALCAGVAVWFARRPVTGEAFAIVQLQLEADARMLREIGAA